MNLPFTHIRFFGFSTPGGGVQYIFGCREKILDKQTVYEYFTTEFDGKFIVIGVVDS